MEVPHLNALYNKYQEKGLVVLGINQEENHAEIHIQTRNTLHSVSEEDIGAFGFWKDPRPERTTGPIKIHY